jgi:2-hydroxychromene-2-carboxylate isomerase
MIDFWFSIGSTYTYLSVMRLPRVAADSGVTFRWRPFNVRHIMIEMDNVPFAKKPVKAAYMWRDLERRAAMYGIGGKFPAPYPLPELERANRVAMLGAAEGWCEAYVREAYRLWFEEGRQPGGEPNLSESLRAAGQNPQEVVPRADLPAAHAALAAATEEAKAAGIFGSPSFIVDGELFWGDDRLEDALAWARQPGLSRRAG